MRIGQGFDAHKFGLGDKLVIGGVIIPHDKGLVAHSDGDVLLHAVCDALLGAAALGDIGQHFPDNDPQYRNADSRTLLQLVVAKLRAAGWQVENCDSTVIAQEPRLASYIPHMIDNLAADLGVEANRVCVKATTTEGMGFTGRGEGIAAQAVVLLRSL
ncbi:MAG: 2-C-methyl-D-erythritol 2,4-cyclodiphosphate synthase [Cellvibrionaceae bacterium]